MIDKTTAGGIVLRQVGIGQASGRGGREGSGEADAGRIRTAVVVVRHRVADIADDARGHRIVVAYSGGRISRDPAVAAEAGE